MVRSGLILMAFAMGYLPSAVGAVEMWMRRANATSTIVLSGEIKAGDADRFKSFWEANAYDSWNFVVAMDSLGGSLSEGVEIGNFIRSVRAKTLVARFETPAPGQSEFDYGDEIPGGGCYSACALAFMGGVEREVSSSAEIGFHQFYGGTYDNIGSALVSGQSIAAFLAGYLREMGAAPQLFETMSMTHPNNMFIPEISELDALGIVPSTIFQNFSLLPRDGIIVAHSSNLRNPGTLERAREIETMCWKGVPILNFYAENADWGLTAEQIGAFGGGFTVRTDTGSWDFGMDRLRLHQHSRVLATLILEPSVAYAIGTSTEAFLGLNSTTSSGFSVSGKLSALSGGDPAIFASFRDCL